MSAEASPVRGNGAYLRPGAPASLPAYRFDSLEKAATRRQGCRRSQGKHDSFRSGRPRLVRNQRSRGLFVRGSLGLKLEDQHLFIGARAMVSGPQVLSELAVVFEPPEGA